MGIFSWFSRLLRRRKYNNFENYAGYGTDRQLDEDRDAQEEFLKSDSEMTPKKRASKKPVEDNDDDFVLPDFLMPAETKAAEPVKARVDVEKKAEKPVTERKSEKTEKKPTTATRKEESKEESKSAPEKKQEVKANPAAEEKKEAKPKPAATEKKESKPVAKKPTEPVEEEIEDDSPEVKGAVAVQESRATANGKFDIRKAKDGRYFFSLYASNHMVIAYSQIYASTNSVNTGINSVIANASKAPIEDTTLKNPTTIPCPKWEIYIEKAGQYRFRLYASNGLCVCHASHGYTTKSGAKGGIDSIRRFAAEARVDKSYLTK